MCCEGFKFNRGNCCVFCWMQQVPAVNGKLKERLHSVSIMGLKDLLVRACRPEKTRLWMNVLGLADPLQ